MKTTPGLLPSPETEPMSCPKFVLCHLLTAMLVLFGQALPAHSMPSTTCTYLETTGEASKHFCLTLLHDGENKVLTYRDGTEIDHTYFSRELTTIRWTVTDSGKSTQIDVIRDSGRLLIQGNLGGEPVERTHEVGDLPWYQALSISLSTLFNDKDADREFWILHPDTLALHRMQVSDIREIELEQGGQTIPVWQVEIRPTGWKSYLWHAHYWFRKSDGRFLRYEGASGPPGAPMTVITLNEEEELSREE